MARNTLIESLGVYLPAGRLSTEEIMEGCRIRPAVDLEGITGIKNRPVVGPKEYALDLAIKAVEKCFEVSRHVPGDIEMVISGSISRLNGPNHEFSFEPSTAAKIASHFGFDRAITFDVSNACAGMFTAVHIMDSFIKSGLIERGMVVSGEYITHLTDNAQKEISLPIDPQLASLTLGDSGTALILEGTNDSATGFHNMDFFTVAKHCDLCVGRVSKEEHGGYAMYTDSAQAHKVAIKFSTEFVGNTIRNTGWENGSSSHTIPHQTSVRAIESFTKTLNDYLGKQIFLKEKMIFNIENRGNTSTTSHFLALWDFIKNGTITSGEELLFVVQASGITVGMATYILDDLPQRIIMAENKAISNNTL